MTARFIPSEHNAADISLLATYAYGDLGRRTSLTRGNGTSTTYGYDPASRLTQLVQNLSGTADDLTLGFAYNPAAQIVSNARSNDAYAYTDLSNQNMTDTHDGLNRIVDHGWMSVSHDARGNVTAIEASSYGYSSENLLTSAPGPTTLTWDPLLRLYETVGGGPTARFAYDGVTIIAEYNASNGIRRRIVHGPGIDEPLVSYEGGGTSVRLWYHADERGSIVALSDNVGAATALQRYDEYGRPQAAPAARFGYTGQPWINGTGLWHYRARMYNPTLGRFMQTDPIGYAGGMNLYAYVANDPVNLTDPMGLDVCTGTLIPSDKPCVIEGGGGLMSGSAGFSGEAGAAFLGLASGGSGQIVFVPGIPGSVTGTGGTGPNQTVFVTAGTPGYFYFAGIFGGGFGAEAGFEYGHRYSFIDEIAPTTCRVSPDAVADIASRFAFVGQDADEPIVHGGIYTANADYGIGLLEGPVQAAISPSGLRTRVTTLLGHPFHGSVTRTWFHGPGGGGLFVHTLGEGRGVRSAFSHGLNQFFGPQGFRSVNARARAYVTNTQCRG